MSQHNQTSRSATPQRDPERTGFLVREVPPGHGMESPSLRAVYEGQEHHGDGPAWSVVQIWLPDRAEPIRLELRGQDVCLWDGPSHAVGIALQGRAARMRFKAPKDEPIRRVEAPVACG